MGLLEKKAGGQKIDNPWRSNLSHIDQLRGGVGLGELQRQRDPDELRNIFEKGVKARFNQRKQGLLLDTYDLAMDLHRGQQPPRRTGAEVGTHPAMLAIMGLYDPEVNAVETAIKLLHDTIEDRRINQHDLTVRLRGIGWHLTTANTIANIVSALDSKGLDQDSYNEQVRRAHQKYSKYGLFHGKIDVAGLKADDRAHNTNDDNTMMVDNPDDVDYAEIERYRIEKAERALRLALELSPNSPDCFRLEAAINTNEELSRERVVAADEATEIFPGTAGKQSSPSL